MGVHEGCVCVGFMGVHGGLVFKAHRLVYMEGSYLRLIDSTLGSRVMKKKKRRLMGVHGG